jgi:hypothetical protein
MNERIRQVLLKVVPMAGEDGEYLPSLHTPEDIERFAELIVRECADVVRYYYIRGERIMSCNITRHFGVEE